MKNLDAPAVTREAEEEWGNKNSLRLPRRYVDPWRRKHRRTHRRRRGLSGCTRHLL